MRNIAVIGLGSMGRRRIRILQSLFDDLHVYGVDSNEERQCECRNQYQVETVASVVELLDEVDLSAAFICTAPLAHAEITAKCLEKNVPVFSEINLVADGYERNIRLAEEKGICLFLSSTFLYRKELQYVVEKVHNTKQSVRYSYHVGQYLADWHPWDNLKDFFISQKRTNGCRELFAIELPWLVAAFGEITGVHVISDMISNLPVDYADSYLVLVEHATGHKGMLAVDVVSREPVRDLTVFGEELFMQWNGRPDGLVWKDLVKNQIQKVDLYTEGLVEQQEGYSANIIENAYVDEVKNFFAVLAGKEEPRYSFMKDKKILELIDQIEMR